MAKKQSNSQKIENTGTNPRVADEVVTWRILENQAFVKITGPDAVAFLQRQTTNDIELVSDNFTITTSLTEPNARLIEVFDVFRVGESHSLLALPFSQNSTSLASYLQKKVFFMDKVEVAVVEDVAFLDIEGDQIQEVLTKIGAPCPDLSLGKLTTIPLSQSEKIAFVYMRRGLYSKFGVRIIGPTQEIKAYGNLLRAINPELSEQDWENLRVAAKFPKSGHEITSNYTPLEAGLEWTVSENKGCYTGQEVIARQITYDKVTKVLVKLRSETFIPAGSTIMSNGRKCGTVTSSALSTPYIGLAILSKSCLESGAALLATTGEVEVPISILE